MLLRSLKRGEADPLLYPLGNRTSSGKPRDFAPEIVCGDPEKFRELWQQCPHTNKDARFVFSYHEDDAPSDRELLRDIGVFLRSACPGVESHAIESCWIRHGQKLADKVKVDIHGYLLGMDLLTGQQITHYYHQSDLARYDLTKQIINLARGYAEPSAPEHARFYGVNREGTYGKIQDKIRRMVESGKALTREDVALQLDAENYRVVRNKDGSLRSKKSLTVVTPDGIKIRIKGDPFHPETAPKVSRQIATSAEALPGMIERLNRMCVKKAKRNWERYRMKVAGQTYEQAEANNFGFSPFTIKEITGELNYEQTTKRNLNIVADHAGANPNRPPDHTSSSGVAGGTTPETGKSQHRKNGPSGGESNQHLKRALGRGYEVVGKIRQVITERLAARRRQAMQR